MSAPCPRYGFALTLGAVAGLSAAARGALWSALTCQLGAQGLLVVDVAPAGLDGRDTDTAATSDGSARGGWQLTVAGVADQAFDADRDALAAWARSRPDVAAVAVGPLVDLREAARR